MAKEGRSEKVVQAIRRKTRRRFSAEEKIRIVLEGRGAKKASPRSVGRRAWRRICTTAGVRSFWRPARDGSSATRRGKRRRVKSWTCGKRTAV